MMSVTGTVGLTLLFFVAWAVSYWAGYSDGERIGKLKGSLEEIERQSRAIRELWS